MGMEIRVGWRGRRCPVSGWLGCLVLMAWLLSGSEARAASDITSQVRHWIDPQGRADIQEVAELPGERWETSGRARTFAVPEGALWLAHDLPPLDPSRRWYVVLSGAAFINQVACFQRDAGGLWRMQHAGDHLPVARWTHPDQTPVCQLDAVAGGTVWLRLENRPAAISPRLQLMTEQALQTRRYHTFLLMGVYLGFGLLVMFLGAVHARLYADRAFGAYTCYVAAMLGFQVSFTGLGGLFLWPHWAWWNDASSAVFMLWLTAAGLWFVREVLALKRHHPGLDRFVWAWSLFGLLYPGLYLGVLSPPAFAVLNAYGLGSVLLSTGLCLWAWRHREPYAGWVTLGFLPLHLAYPFPALRSVGLMPDHWTTQYALVLGSAVEIPLLLHVLHRRAKDFNENRARMRALDSTDPLTGLTLPPVLMLRLRDAMRRARRHGHSCGLVLVELSNHEELGDKGGAAQADRALVVTASQLSGLVRDLDTVSRVEATRFAMLLEGPYRPEMLRRLAQHIVARGLAATQGETPLRLKVVTIALPDWTLTEPSVEEQDVTRLLDRLQRAMDHMDSGKVVLHLPLPVFSASPPGAHPSPPERS